MKELIEYIVKELVDKPEKVKVEQNTTDKNTFELKIEVDRNDIGKVVGKQGKNINALRIILTAAAAKNHHRATLQVLE
jgi:predicted RNA-binding protein YlqC (UPF0109 family)